MKAGMWAVLFMTIIIALSACSADHSSHLVGPSPAGSSISGESDSDIYDTSAVHYTESFIVCDTIDYGMGYLIDIKAFSLEFDNYIYTEKANAGAYIEYLEISGLKDLEKQERINAILKRGIFERDEREFNPDLIIKCKVRLEYISTDLLSLSWSRYANSAEAAHPSDTVQGMTIDLRTGNRITLGDFMEVDERLIHRGDGNSENPDYNSPSIPRFHIIKDVLEIYENEEEWDGYHWHALEEAIVGLQINEADWYLNEGSDIVFLHIKNSIEVPYQNLADLIYPEYLEILERNLPETKE